MPEVEVKGLFPTPFMRVAGLAPAALVAELAARAEAPQGAAQANFKSEQLHHSDIGTVDGDGPYGRLGALVTPYLAQFGALLFGESLRWSIKEIWANVLEHGGRQAVHSHSNSFISGIVYLTASHPSSRTVFHRGLGGREFVFANDNPNAKMGPYNGSKWVAPACAPGDMVLYPSYLLHEVPPNQGERRMTVAFNAIPDRLDSWGYAVEFASRPSTVGN